MLNPPPSSNRFRILYGGTFDPVHAGHLAVARHARDALDAEIHLMPAADPPHKGPTRADAQQRAQMLQLAVADTPGLCMDLRELSRKGPSYTVDTLRGLRAEVGNAAPWAILIGADSFAGLHRWHRWRELFDLAHVVVASRGGPTPGGTFAAGLQHAAPDVVVDAVRARVTDDAQALHTQPAGLVFEMDQPLFPQSSSELRRRIEAGKPWRDWVTPAVAAYIERHGLYR